MSSSKPITQPQTRGSSSRPSPPRLSSIVTGDLVQPSNDPSTGLAIFPRLPEVYENTATTKTTSTASNTTSAYQSPFTDEAPLKEPERSRSFSNRLIGLFSPSSITASTLPTVPREPVKQPVQRREQLSGGHVYCRHTWDEECKCLNIMTLDQGDYCASCWAAGCRGSRPLGARTGSS